MSLSERPVISSVEASEWAFGRFPKLEGILRRGNWGSTGSLSQKKIGLCFC